MTAKKCTKKRDARAEFVLPIQHIPCFLPFSLSSLSWDLEVPNTRTTENGALMEKWGYSAVARLDLLGGGGQSRVPKARAARGVRGHAPLEDFELQGL